MSSNHITAWTTLFGSSLDNQSNDVVIGNDGSIYITGSKWVHLDHHYNTALYDADAFVSKFNNDGEIQWTKLLGTNEEDYGRGIAIDNNDSIYMTGNTKGDLNGKSNSGGNDAFLIK